MSNHTPGPWIISDDDIVGQRYIARLADWCIVGAGSQYQDIEDMLTHERNANARLISAAPDMLAALEMVNDMLPDMPSFMWQEFDDGSSPASIIKAAIARAKGEA